MGALDSRNVVLIPRLTAMTNSGSTNASKPLYLLSRPAAKTSPSAVTRRAAELFFHQVGNASRQNNDTETASEVDPDLRTKKSCF
jgi:hypothetical protein